VSWSGVSLFYLNLHKIETQTLRLADLEVTCLGMGFFSGGGTATGGILCQEIFNGKCAYPRGSSDARCI